MAGKCPDRKASPCEHVIGIGLAVGLAAAVFFAASWGYLRLLRIPSPTAAPRPCPPRAAGCCTTANVLYAFAAVAGTGLLAGIFIAVRQISPLPPGYPAWR